MKLGKASERIEELNEKFRQFESYQLMENLRSEGPAGLAFQKRFETRPPFTGTLLELLDKGASEIVLTKHIKNELDELIGINAKDEDIEGMLKALLLMRKSY